MGISLRTGEKRLKETDLSVGTPGGQLAFTRAYRQFPVDDYPEDNTDLILGLGWTHNHHIRLLTDYPRAVIMPSGGKAYIDEDDSLIELDYDSGEDQYILTAVDQSSFVFDADGKLLSRSWADGQTWTYTYTGDKLTEVDDGYGRKLCLAYYTGGDRDGQLWQVGDHQTTDLGTASPSGRYVEFDYDLLDTLAVLVSVKDSRGQTWTYRYYGQEPGEDNPGLTGFLIARDSPDVDLTGNGTTESTITLEELEYEMESTGIEVIDDDQMEDEDWIDYILNAAPVTNDLSYATGIGYIRDVETSTDYQGIQSKEFYLTPGWTYEISAKVKTSTNPVEMSLGNEYVQTTSTDSWEILSYQFTVPNNYHYPSDTLKFRAWGATQFQVGQVSVTKIPPRPTAVTQQLGIVDDSDPLLETNFEFRPSDRNDTTETQADRVTTHYFAGGTYVGTGNPAGEGSGRSVSYTRPTALVDGRANLTQMVWSHENRHLFKVIDPFENEVNIRHDRQNRLTQVSDAKGRKTHYFYDHAATPNLPSAQIVAERDLIVGGDMETNEDWTGIGTGLSFSFNDFDYVDSGQYCQWVVAYQIGDGIESQPFDLTSLAIVTARVMPIWDTVKMGLSGTSSYDVLSTGNMEWETFSVQVPGGLQDQTLQFTGIITDTHPFLVDSVSVLTDIVSWRTFAYVEIAGQYHLQQEDRLDPDDGTSVLSRIEYEYYLTGIRKGLLKTITQKDMVGSEVDIVTTYDYDDFGRLLQIDKTATVDGYENLRFVYDEAGNVVAEIINYDAGTPPETADQAEDLYDGSKPDKNHVTTYRYNSLGWLVETTTMAGSPYAATRLVAYDALGRVIRTIENYVESPGVSDPFVADREDFGHGTGNDQNLVVDTTYNERGLVRSMTDVLGNITLYGYNEADRLVRLVRNASQPDYDNSYDGDPALADYPDPKELSEDTDQDIVTEWEYDTAGNPVKIVDPNGDITFMVYDALNRPIKQVERAKAEATLDFEPEHDGYDADKDPRSPDYVASTALDHDIITEWEYDELGDVAWHIDPLDRETEFSRDLRSLHITRNIGEGGTADENIGISQEYDILKRLSSVSDGGKGLQFAYEYDGFDRVKTSTINEGGEGPDQDLTTQTVYNDQGQVRYTTDPLGRKTWYVYDSLGRVIKTIVNCTYVDGVTTPESPSYVGSLDTDKDLISRIDYDPVNIKPRDSRAVRVIVETGPLGNKTVHQLDRLGREVCTIQNFSNGIYSDDHPDQDRTTRYFYDLAGRLVRQLDVEAGVTTGFEYDRAGRQTAVINNHKSGGTQVDQNVTERAEYDKAGRLIATSNPWKIRTTYEYGAQGRVQAITRAAGTRLAVTDWVCYDRAGQVLRTIQACTYDPDYDEYSPIEQNQNGDWRYTPVWNGTDNDRNLITEYSLDKRGRPLTITDPMGNQASFTYAFGGGKIEPPLMVTDPAGNMTYYVYDELSRVRYTVRNIVPNDLLAINYGDSMLSWNAGQWELFGVPVNHGNDKDQNIITEIEYDEVGRQTAVRDPNGNQTAFEYDDLDRRTALTDPLSHTWQTIYEHRDGGVGLRVRQINPNSDHTSMEFDLLGRPHRIDYTEVVDDTPDISFEYDRAGNRTRMVEKKYGAKVRQTRYHYDGMHRPIQVKFDIDGNDIFDQHIDYTYYRNGLLKRLSPSGGVGVDYYYDARDRVNCLDADGGQSTDFIYDHADRLRRVERSGGLYSHYNHDPNGRLLAIEHTGLEGLLGRFSYEYDVLGNPKSGYEYTSHAGTPEEILVDATSDIPVEIGTWTTVGFFKETENFSARLELDASRGHYILTLGTGPDHGICHIYLKTRPLLGESTVVAEWELDNYSPIPGERNIDIPAEGNRTLVIKNTTRKNIVSSGRKLRFKQLATLSTRAVREVTYEYDAQSRVKRASYIDPMQPTTHHNNHVYTYDYAGNLIEYSNGVVPISSFVLDAANRIDTATIDSQPVDYTYDAAGQMIEARGNETTTYTWDRAGRLLNVGNTNYTYNGQGQRVQMENAGTPTDYLVNPLTGQVLLETTNYQLTRGVFGPTGLHAQKQPNDTWLYPLTDGLGSVRLLANPQGQFIEARWYAPHGSLDSGANAASTYGFVGAMTDPNGLLSPGPGAYYDPALARLLKLGPWEQFHANFKVLADYAGDPNNPFGNRLKTAGLAGAYGTLWYGAWATWFVGSLFLGAPYADALLGTTLIGAGVSGLNYAIKHPDTDFWDKQYWGAMGHGALGGLEFGMMFVYGHATGGVIGNLGLSGRALFAANAASDIGFGMAWDIGIHGDMPSRAFWTNTAGFAAGELVSMGLTRHLDGLRYQVAADDSAIRLYGGQLSTAELAYIDEVLKPSNRHLQNYHWGIADLVAQRKRIAFAYKIIDQEDIVGDLSDYILDELPPPTRPPGRKGRRLHRSPTSIELIAASHRYAVDNKTVEITLGSFTDYTAGTAAGRERYWLFSGSHTQGQFRVPIESIPPLSQRSPFILAAHTQPGGVNTPSPADLKMLMFYKQKHSLIINEAFFVAPGKPIKHRTKITQFWQLGFVPDHILGPG